jgi:hypothetical protein
MKRIIVLVAALGALAVPVAAGAQSTDHRHACSIVHRYLGAHGHFKWTRGITHDPAAETLRTTSYAYGSDSCHPIAFQRWFQIINLVFARQERGHGSFSGPSITGTWRHLRTVQVPKTCGGDGGSLSSTPYGWFSLRVSDLDGRLIDTGTVKLRLAC